MSAVENVLNTEHQNITNYDVSKFLLGDNYFASGDVTASGADVVLLQGMVMGRIAATGKLTPCVATATDGSQIPVGVAIITKTVLDGTTIEFQLVNKGKIDEGILNFAGAETLATLIGPTNNQRSYRDYLADLGLILELGEELTLVDNQ